MRVLIIHEQDPLVYSLARTVQALPVVEGIALVEAKFFQGAFLKDFEKVIVTAGISHPPALDILAPIFSTLTEQNKSVLAIGGGAVAIANSSNFPLLQLAEPLYAKAQKLRFKGTLSNLFKGINRDTLMGYYVGWVPQHPLPKGWGITALTENGIIAAFKHFSQPIQAVVFHPSSSLSMQGTFLLENWVKS